MRSPSRSTPCTASLAWLGSVLALAGCAAADGGEPEADLKLAGGETTVADRSSNAFTFPAPNLTEAQLERHLDGDLAFEDTFVSPPAVVNAGLGPLFNNNACTKCHVRDGRALPVAGPGPLGSPLLVRVSLADGEPEVPGGPVPAPGLGTQLQDHAVHGVAPEATVELEWIEQAGNYGDGEPYSLRRPRLRITLADGSMLSRDVLTSARIPPPVFGLGLLEAVAEEDILAREDPDDDDGDGISGRANHAWDVALGAAALGRFGWKASVPTLRQQAASAYANDIGVSSPVFPEPDGSFEVEDATLRAVTTYTQTLAVPQRAAQRDADTRRGEAAFRELGCGDCHAEQLQTGKHEIAALADQTIHPYTDLLLHNMGFDLADGRADFLASGTEWRTPPLWGLGLTQTVLPYSSFLHDGRARTMQEAILWHGGEAQTAKEAFRTLPAREREALLAFLRAL